MVSGSKREELISKAKSKVREQLTRKDILLIQAVRTLDDIDKAKSLLLERLTEWFKVNFPELEIQSEEQFLKLLSLAGSKETLEKAHMEEALGADRAQKMHSLIGGSMGAPFDASDSKIIMQFAKRLHELFLLRKDIEEYIGVEAKVTLKNLSFLVEPVLAARLISTAGSLENLAKMPASTIQVIGAEKALFKHLRSGTRPPKHGVIFQAPMVGTAPLKQRGKMARALSTKLTIAAKADFYSHNFIADKLKADLERRMKEIRG
ncbi:MAG: NOP5/NOP56 family protein [Candidatus Micrarchaeota archaeon]